VVNVFSNCLHGWSGRAYIAHEMRSTRLRIAGAVMGAMLALWGRAAPMFEAGRPLNAADVIQRMLTRAQQGENWGAKADFSYTRLTVTEELDASGNVKDRKEKAHQVYCRKGVTSEKVLTVSGRPQTAGEPQRPAHEGADSRGKEAASKRRHADNRENYLTPEIVDRFNFNLIGEETLNGRPSYQIAFAPKQPALPVHHTADRVLNRISGTVWVDAEEFEIARAEFSLGSEVQFLGGVIGCLKKLAFTLMRTRMDDGFWLNTLSVAEFEGRKVFASFRVRTRSQSSDFHPLRLAG